MKYAYIGVSVTSLVVMVVAAVLLTEGHCFNTIVTHARAHTHTFLISFSFYISEMYCFSVIISVSLDLCNSLFSFLLFHLASLRACPDEF